MIRRRGKPPWSHARVVKACPALSSTDKLIWLEHRDLTNHGPCTMSASQLGRRVGVHRVTVERARQDLQSVDLFVRADRGPGRTANWFPQLPVGCRPVGRQLTDDEVEQHAELLAVHVARARENGAPERSAVKFTHAMSEL